MTPVAGAGGRAAAASEEAAARRADERVVNTDQEVPVGHRARIDRRRGLLLGAGAVRSRGRIESDLVLDVVVQSRDGSVGRDEVVVGTTPENGS